MGPKCTEAVTVLHGQLFLMPWENKESEKEHHPPQGNNHLIEFHFTSPLT